MTAEEERQKEENYHKKLRIIDSIKNLTESSDDFNKLYKEFKDLQQQWNDTASIPQSKEKELWKSYQVYTEKFYDLIKINNEFRDYDFKKNLELKAAICESVEKLIEEPDAVSAFHQLQNFHQQWREIGPVARELREEIWVRFKDASTAINKSYQTHFESLKGKEEDNLTAKTAICEALRNIDYSLFTSFRHWDEKSKEVIDLQAKWKTIGFVPKKVNNQIFEEFRALCDTFFEKKSEFFKGVRDEMDTNLSKKRALCEQAKALKDNIDWKSTADKLIVIQKEWKTIGPVPRKYSDAIWKEFVSACDYFFEQKKKNESSQKTEELDNLTAKKEIIEKIKNIDQALESSEVISQVRALADEWHKIGFVPFKEKDKIYKEFHQAVDDHYDRLKMDKAERKFESFKSNIKDNLSKQDNPKKSLYRERDHLMHQYNKVKSDLQTYENNMNFLSISSKGAGGLLKDVNNKIENLKNELNLIVKKIEAIDENLNELEQK
jgi:chromosome segregation ATPase